MDLISLFILISMIIIGIFSLKVNIKDDYDREFMRGIGMACILFGVPIGIIGLIFLS